MDSRHNQTSRHSFIATARYYIAIVLAKLIKPLVLLLAYVSRGHFVIYFVMEHKDKVDSIHNLISQTMETISTQAMVFDQCTLDSEGQVPQA